MSCDCDGPCPTCGPFPLDRPAGDDLVDWAASWSVTRGEVRQLVARIRADQARLAALPAIRDTLAAAQWDEVEMDRWACLCQGHRYQPGLHHGPQPPARCSVPGCWVERVLELAR